MGGYRGGWWLTYVCSRQGLLVNPQNAAVEWLLFRIRASFIQGYFRVWLMFRAQFGLGRRQGNVCTVVRGQSALEWRSDPLLCTRGFGHSLLRVVGSKSRCSFCHSGGGEVLTSARFLQEESVLHFDRPSFKPTSAPEWIWSPSFFCLVDWQPESEQHLEVKDSVRPRAGG